MSIVLNGNSSTLSCDFFPPIDLTDGQWEIGLIDLSVYNSIPNIEDGINNKLYLGRDENDNHEVTVSIPTGSYEIEDIEKYIKSQLPPEIAFSLKPNNNTLKAEIKCSKVINFKDGSIGKLLGFNNGDLSANRKHESVLPVDIIKVNVIRVACNIVTGSFQNGKESHNIHEFYPQVPPGYKIVEIPTTVIYLPVNVKTVHNITVSLRDQNEAPINFRDESVSVRLHLRRNGSRI